MADQTIGDYPGQRLGLPKSGPGSVAGWGRRMAALAVDWVLSTFVVSAFTGSTVQTGLAAAYPLVAFVLEAWILTSLLGGSAGQLIVGIRVLRTDRSRLDPTRVLLRTALIALVIPPVIYDRDQRGLHDLATDAMTVKV